MQNKPSNVATVEIESVNIDDRAPFGAIRCAPKDEDGHMITESALVHIESLLNRAKNNESTQSKWDFVNKALSSCLTLFVSTSGFLITDYYDDGFNLPDWFTFFLCIISICSVVLGIILFQINKAKIKDWDNGYKGYIIEALELLAKLRWPKNEAKRANKQT